MAKTPHRPLCAVTGTSGYLGGCVKHHFESAGWDVLELTRNPCPGTRARRFQLGAAVEPGTLAGVSALVHCAYDFRPVRWAEIAAVNIAGTEKLLAAARAAGVGRIICISSISAFEGCRSWYGRAKLEVERIAQAVGAFVIRPGLIYGDTPQGMFGKLVAQVEGASFLPLFGGGSQIQYLVHEADLCAFIGACAAGEFAPPEVPMTVAHDQPWTFRQILEAIAQAKGKRLHFIPVPWRLVWAGIRCAELLRMPLDFRSDSLVSLMHQNPRPDFSRPAGFTGNIRAFSCPGFGRRL